MAQYAYRLKFRYLSLIGSTLIQRERSELYDHALRESFAIWVKMGFMGTKLHFFDLTCCPKFWWHYMIFSEKIHKIPNPHIFFVGNIPNPHFFMVVPAPKVSTFFRISQVKAIKYFPFVYTSPFVPVWSHYSIGFTLVYTNCS